MRVAKSDWCASLRAVSVILGIFGGLLEIGDAVSRRLIAAAGTSA